MHCLPFSFNGWHGKVLTRLVMQTSRFYQTNFRSNLTTHKMSTILIRKFPTWKFKNTYFKSFIIKFSMSICGTILQMTVLFTFSGRRRNKEQLFTVRPLMFRFTLPSLGFTNGRRRHQIFLRSIFFNTSD